MLVRDDTSTLMYLESLLKLDQLLCNLICKNNSVLGSMYTSVSLNLNQPDTFALFSNALTLVYRLMRLQFKWLMKEYKHHHENGSILYCSLERMKCSPVLPFLIYRSQSNTINQKSVHTSANV